MRRQRTARIYPLRSTRGNPTPAAAEPILQPILSELIVKLFLFRITQNLVSPDTALFFFGVIFVVLVLVLFALEKRGKHRDRAGSEGGARA